MRKITIDDLVSELEDARLTAKANGQGSAMVASILAKAKLLGMDRIDSRLDSEPQPISVIIQTVDARKPQ